MCKKSVVSKWVYFLLILSFLGCRRAGLAAASYKKNALTYMEGHHNHTSLRGLVGGFALLFLVKNVACDVWNLWPMIKGYVFADVPKQGQQVSLDDFLSNVRWGELVLLLSSMYIIKFRLAPLLEYERRIVLPGKLSSRFSFLGGGLGKSDLLCKIKIFIH